MGNQEKISILRFEGVWPPLPGVPSFWENPHFRVILSHLLKNYLHCSLLMETWHYIIKPPDSIQSHPRQSPDPSRHLPDTFKTPHRHPKFGHFLSIQYHWEKSYQLIRMSLMGCLWIACTSYLPRHYSKSLRQPQTPPYHFSDILHTAQSMAFFTKPRQLGERDTANKNDLV